MKPRCGNCDRAIARGVASECVYPAAPRKRGPKKGYREAITEKLNALEALLKPLQSGALQGHDLTSILTSLQQTSQGRNDNARSSPSDSLGRRRPSPEDEDDESPSHSHYGGQPSKRQRQHEEPQYSNTMDSGFSAPAAKRNDGRFNMDNEPDPQPQLTAASALEMMLFDPASPSNSQKSAAASTPAWLAQNSKHLSVAIQLRGECRIRGSNPSSCCLM